MRTLIPRHWREVDKRRQILLAFGFIWCAIGYGVLLRPVQPGQEHLLFSAIPVWLRTGAWCVTGLVAIGFALRPRSIHDDGLGFLALYVMPVERCAIFLWGWFQWLAPGGNPGYSAGLFSAAVWLAITVAVMACSRGIPPGAPPKATP